MENPEIEEVYDEGRIFLEEVKKIIHKAIQMDKKVEFKNDDILILSLKDDLHGVFEVYNLINDDFTMPKLVYIGDKRLRNSYLLNLINKEENRALLKQKYSQ